MTIVERMFEVMEQKGIKAVDLATKINVSKSVISTWKKRNTDPPANFIVQICEFLGVSIQFLITGGDPPESAATTSFGDKAILDQVQHLTENQKLQLSGAISMLIAMQNTPFASKESLNDLGMAVDKEVFASGETA